MIDTNSFILLPLDEVVDYFKQNGYDVEVIDNNYNVIGDTKLVTNIVINDNIARIYYGEFIFNLEGKIES